jgi:hypothetical protein
MMVLNNPELERAEQEALSILDQQSSPYSPVELIRDLRNQQVSESVARAAIWYLIDRYEVELTWDRQLRRVRHEVAHAR